MNRRLIIILLLLAPLLGFAQQIKVACIGNSITQGVGTRNEFLSSYPGVLSQMLGDAYLVRNYGITTRTMMNSGDVPYMKEDLYQEALEFNPDIVTIKLGTNDSKPENWIHKADFKGDLEKMVSDFQALPSKPVIYLCYPVPPTALQWGISDSVIVNGIIPVIRQVAKEKKTKIIDLHKALKPYPECFPDHVHPNEEGAQHIAAAIYRSLTGKKIKNFTMNPFPGKKSEWNGFDRYDFEYRYYQAWGYKPENGYDRKDSAYRQRKVTVVVPKTSAPGKPWIWRPAFFGAFPSVDKALLEKGFHVAYYDLTHLYGSPRAVELGDGFYKLMVESFGLNPKVTLEGFSRGGLFAFNWAETNSDKVACIYVDAPVCNVFSWPGRKENKLWNDLLLEWRMTDQDMYEFKGNPIDHLYSLAKAGIPIISVCGDSDSVVPYSQNMQIVKEKYTTLGGKVEVILKPGVDHHPHSLEDPAPVVDFIIKNQK